MKHNEICRSRPTNIGYVTTAVSAVLSFVSGQQDTMMMIMMMMMMMNIRLYYILLYYIITYYISLS